MKTKLQYMDIVITYKRRIVRRDHVLNDVAVYLGDGVTTSRAMRAPCKKYMVFLLRRIAVSEMQSEKVKEALIKGLPRNLYRRVQAIADIFREAGAPVCEKTEAVKLMDIATSNYVHVIRVKQSIKQ